MRFEDIGKKVDSFIDNKVKPKVKEMKESDYVENKVKPVAKSVLQKGSEGLAKAAERVSKTEETKENEEDKR